MSTELNGIKISALPDHTTLSGNEMVPFASGGTNGRFALKRIFDRINDAVKSLAPSSDVTALRNSLNSLQSRLDTLVNGNSTAVIDTFTEIESFLAGVTNKETLTGLLAELKTQVQSYADTGLAGKVDKEYIDRLSVRFTLVGYVNEKGAYVGSGELPENLTDWTNKSACTDFMPLNRYHDVKIFSRCTNIHSVIAFYDGSLNFISNIVLSETEAGFTQKTISKDTFPTGAVFFRCSSYVGQNTIMPKCDNGESVGAREGAMANAIGEARVLALIDNFKALHRYKGIGSTEFSYEPAANPLKPFIVNHVPLTYDEALVVYNAGVLIRPCERRFQGFTGLKTNINGMQLTTAEAIMRETFYMCESLEVANVRLGRLSGGTFYNCSALREIIGPMYVIEQYTKDAFKGCVALETLPEMYVQFGFSLEDSPLLTLQSMRNIIAHPSNTTAITVTVHPDVYAKLTDTANAEWFKVLTDAVAKNISFAIM